MNTKQQATVQRIDKRFSHIKHLEAECRQAAESLGNISPYSVGDRFIRDTRYCEASSEWELISVDAQITDDGLRWVGEMANVRKDGSIGQSRIFIQGKAGKPAAIYCAYQPKCRAGGNDL